jgi:hypothetical protein
MMTKRIRVSVNLEHTYELVCARWWRAALANRVSAPVVLKRLLAGVDVIEVTEQEGQAIKEWAEGIDGWADAPEDAKPLLLQPTEQIGIL